MSDDEDEPEEDWRIAKLYGVADKSSPEEFAALVDEVGTRDAVCFGSVMMDRPSARAHFVVLALIDLDDGSLAECLTARRALLKAAVAAGGAGAGSALLAALEGLLCSPATAVEGEARESAMTSFDEALKVLWEYEVVSEDEVRLWQADERAGRNYQVSGADAIRLHEKGREFLEWVDEGE